MPTITRSQFLQQFQGRSISVEKVARDPSLTDAQKADFQQADLNGDGFVRGSSELGRLFNELDDRDRNGSRHSFSTTSGGATSAAGLGYQAALNAVEAAPQGGGFTNTAEGRFAELLTREPGLQTHQDLINFFFRRGNNTWNGASSAASHYGQDLVALTRDRGARIDRDAAIGAGSSQGTNPTNPTPPTTPTTPTNPTDATGFVTEAGRTATGFGQTRDAREAQAEAILRSMGQWPPQEGQAYAIQIDQDTPPASASSSARRSYLRSYSGQTSVFKFEGGQLKEVSDRVYRSASHTGQFNSSLSPDVNGDGRGDIAHIRPGVYNYTTRMHRSGGKRRLNPLDNGEFRNSARDLNHNGVIDGRETDREYSASAIQIHEGGSNTPISIGCQTLPPGDFTQFMDDVREADTSGNRKFTYILMRRPNDRYGANPF